MRPTKNILVTGGAGFIGSALIRATLASTPHRVLNVDALTYAANPESLRDVERDPRYSFLKADIRDGRALLAAMHAFQPDAIVNLAAESHVDRSIDAPAQFITTNIVGTFTLLECALEYFRTLPRERQDAFRFLQVSTDEVYGDNADIAEGTPQDETAAYRPSSPYAASKASADHLVRAWHRTYGLPVVVTASSNNYGPWQMPEKLIPLMTLRASEGLPLPVYGDGEQVRDWLFVEDHAAALLRVIEAAPAGSTYNVCGGCELRNIDVVTQICRVLDEIRPPSAIGLRKHADLITFVADRPGHDRRYRLDGSRVTRELGWQPRGAFAENLGKTVRWYWSNPEWRRAAAERVLYLHNAHRPGFATREGT